MRKREELSSKDSCMGHAHPNEMTFVLLGPATSPRARGDVPDVRVQRV